MRSHDAAAETIEQRAGHAVADVERDRHVDRQPPVADVVDPLRDVVVEHLEIFGGEPGDRAARAVAHGDVYRDRDALDRNAGCWRSCGIAAADSRQAR